MLFQIADTQAFSFADRSRIRFDLSCQYAHQSRLSRTVIADQTDPLFFAQMQGYIVQYILYAETLPDFLCR